MELKELLDKCINDRLIDLTIRGQKVTGIRIRGKKSASHQLFRRRH